MAVSRSFTQFRILWTQIKEKQMLQVRNRFNLTGHTQTHIHTCSASEFSTFFYCGLVSWQMFIPNDYLMFSFVFVILFALRILWHHTLANSQAIANCMKTFTEVFAKSQLASTSYTANNMCCLGFFQSMFLMFCVWFFRKSFVWHDMTKCLPSFKPCVRIDFYGWIHTALSQHSFDIYMHWWSILVIELSTQEYMHKRETNITRLCVMHVWRTEKATAAAAAAYTTNNPTTNLFTTSV